MNVSQRDRSFLLNAATTVACSLIATIVLLIVAAPRAEAAARYNVVQCHESYNDNAADAKWLYNTGAYWGVSGCPTGGLRIGHNQGVPISVYAWSMWQWASPPGAVIEKTDFSFNLQSGQGHVAYWYLSSEFGTVASWSSSTSGWTWWGSQPIHARSLNAVLYCPGASCPNSSSVHTYIKNLNFTLSDYTAPTLALTGSLLSQGPARGHESLIVKAADQGGGISTGGSLKVNGDPVSPSPSGACAQAAENGASKFFVPCPTSPTFTYNLNTEEPPFREGQNTVEACVQDYDNLGSSPNRTCKSASFTVDNSCPRSATTQEATGLSAQLTSEGGAEGRSIAVRSNEEVTVEGTLTGASGPVGGGLVCVYEEIDGDARSVVQTGYTRPNGTFKIDVDAGPSRSFDVGYRANNKQTDFKALRADSTAVPTLRVKNRSLHNGQAAKFRGEIPGPRAEGRAVTLQARAGKKWRTFKQLRTRSGGKFKAKYPFRHTTGNVRYRFRALVKRQDGYPYLAGSSKKAKVRVRG